MPESAIKQILLPGVLIAAGFVAVFFLSGQLTLGRPSLPDEFADSDLNMNGSRLRGFLFGAEGLVADWYYMRALQYIGDKMIAAGDRDINLEDLTDLNPRLLYPLLDNATDLDPHFIAAYSYGAMVLPAIDKQKAIALTEKGIANNPDQWRLHQYLGYVYWRVGQYEKAAETYEKGSLVPGSSPFMKLMAAAMKTRGGSRETARAIYAEMLAATDDEQIKITAARRLMEIDSLDEREAVDRVLAEAREKTGRCPASIGEIFPQLKSVQLPNGRQFRIDRSNALIDPSGAPYLLDQTACKITLDRGKTGIAAQ